jgi:hypothetical protein
MIEVEGMVYSNQGPFVEELSYGAEKLNRLVAMEAQRPRGQQGRHRGKTRPLGLRGSARPWQTAVLRFAVVSHPVRARYGGAYAAAHAAQGSLSPSGPSYGDAYRGLHLRFGSPPCPGSWRKNASLREAADLFWFGGTVLLRTTLALQGVWPLADECRYDSQAMRQHDC